MLSHFFEPARAAATAQPPVSAAAAASTTAAQDVKTASDQKAITKNFQLTSSFIRILPPDEKAVTLGNRDKIMRFHTEHAKYFFGLIGLVSEGITEIFNIIISCIKQNSENQILIHLKKFDEQIIACNGLTDVKKEYVLKLKCHLLAYAAFGLKDKSYSHVVANIDQQIFGQASDDKAQNSLAAPKFKEKVEEVYKDFDGLKKLLRRLAPWKSFDNHASSPSPVPPQGILSAPVPSRRLYVAQ